jgi:hypothetical protein
MVVDDVDEGPMSLWKAIEGLRSTTRCIGWVSKGKYLYLNEM